MANNPYRNPILNAIYRTAQQRPPLKALLPRNLRQSTILPPDDRWSREQRLIYDDMRPSLERELRQGVLVMSSDELMRGAQKSLSFNQYVLDFINDAGYRDNYRYYDRGTLENAYRTSVYLFAFLRKAADMLSTVNFIAERKQGDVWVETDEAEPIVQIFEEQGADVLFRGYMNYAIYGNVLIYIRKTYEAVLAQQQGREDAGTYARGGVAGFHVISGRNFDLDVDYGDTELRGFFLGTQEPGMHGRNYLRRDECVYIWDYDPKDDWRGTSIVNAAIHNAVTNAAIARWASHYFTTGAMPMILVSAKGSDPYSGAATDIQKEKYKFEQNWRGVGASMRAHFTERQVQVDQVGIEADKVAAPELNRTALEGISAATRIPVDLIIPPQGGSDNARHKYLMKQAWEDTILPMADQFCAAFNRDIGMPDGLRLLVDRSAIDALKADRGERAQTEINITSGGLQSFNEARLELDMPTVRPMRGLLNVGGAWRSPRTIRLQDRLLGATFSDLLTAWDSNLITRRQWHALLGLPLPPTVRDGYKFEVVQESSTGGMSDILQKVEVAGPEVLLTNQGAAALAEKNPDSPAGTPGHVPPEPGALNPEAAQALPDSLSVTESPAQKAWSMGQAELYVVGQIAADDHPALDGLQQILVQALPESSVVRLVPHDEFHVTLWYVPVFGGEDEQPYLDALPDTASGEAVISGLGAFAQQRSAAGEWCIYAALEPDSLQALRQAFAPPLPEERLSSYSLKYQPHITLAYATALPDDFDPANLLGPDAILRLRIDSVVVSRTPGDILKTIPESPQTPPETAQRAALGEGAQTPANALESPAAQESSHFPLAEREDMLQMKAVGRAAWGRELERATAYGDPSVAALPERIKDSLRALEQEGVAFDPAKDAVRQALEAGWYDEDAAPEDNPAKAYLAQGDWKTELAAWEHSALRNWNKAVNRFVAYHLPPSVVEEVRTSLKATDRRDKEAIRGLFAGVRDGLAQKGTRPEHIAAWAKEIWALDDADLKALFD